MNSEDLAKEAEQALEQVQRNDKPLTPKDRLAIPCQEMPAQTPGV